MKTDALRLSLTLLCRRLDMSKHFKEKWLPRPLSKITKLLTVTNFPHNLFFLEVYIETCSRSFLARSASKRWALFCNFPHVPLFLKTMQISHVRTPVVSPYVVVVFSKCNEQCLNPEVRLTPQDWQEWGVCWLYVHVCVYAAFLATVISTDFVGLEHLEPKILTSTKRP